MLDLFSHVKQSLMHFCALLPQAIFRANAQGAESWPHSLPEEVPSAPEWELGSLGTSSHFNKQDGKAKDESGLQNCRTLTAPTTNFPMQFCE